MENKLIPILSKISHICIIFISICIFIQIKEKQRISSKFHEIACCKKNQDSANVLSTLQYVIYETNSVNTYQFSKLMSRKHSPIVRMIAQHVTVYTSAVYVLQVFPCIVPCRHKAMHNRLGRSAPSNITPRWSTDAARGSQIVERDSPLLQGEQHNRVSVTQLFYIWELCEIASSLWHS